MKLLNCYTRVSNSKTYLGWKDFIHDLNSFINKYARKSDDNMEYVTISSQSHYLRDGVVLLVYLGDEATQEESVIFKAAKYFIESQGLKVDQVFWNKPESEVKFHVHSLNRFEIPEHYSRMKNLWMKDALEKGQIIDVRQVGVELGDGVFKINEFIPSTTYVDSQNEEFLFSIGRDRETGEIFGAYDTRFYNDPDYETLYLH